MQYPVKGSECTHERSFDFMNFITQHKNNYESWRCPICSVSIQRLVYIPLYRYLIKRVETSALNFYKASILSKAEEVKLVFLNQDGTVE